MRLSPGASPLAAVLLALLLALQAAPAFHAASQAAGSQTPPQLGRSSVTFSPHYIIMGQIEGPQLVQSLRPQSVPLPEGISYSSTYYTPQDLQDAYNATGLTSQGYDGRGETIAIIDAYGDPTIQQDLATFDTHFDLPAANLSIIPVGTYAPENGITYGWDSEVALDVEAAHTMAPYASIDLVVAANASNALYEAVKMVVDEHLANVVSMSWGLGENTYGESGFSVAGFLNYAYLDYYFQKGAAEGITFLASSGDYGAFDGSTAVTADFPSTSPFVTAVGGTTLFLGANSGYVSALNSSAIYQGEQAWSVSPQYVGAQGVSSGGGFSSIFAQPYYQEGATTSAVRSVPDVSAVANPYTGFVIVLEGGLYAIGGTSLATPLWAGMAADIDQFTGKSLGLLNPYLYSIYGDKGEYDAAFHQVTSGFNGEYSAGPGYNMVTGLGTPDLPALAVDIRNQSQGLSVSVTTSQSSSPSAPAQYNFGESFTISATLTSQLGTVSSGSFTASVVGPGGRIASVPLSYNGVSWTGSYTPTVTEPPGEFTVEVQGSSGGLTGEGFADVNFGDSLGIISPVPYPFATTTPPDVPFTVQAVGEFPNGTAIQAVSLDAHLTYEGRTISDVTLTEVGPGFYSGMVNITAGDPQGTYTLTVGGPDVGSVYTYLYVGEAVTGVMMGPTNTAIESAAPGQEVVFLAKTLTSTSAGEYTSNVTANIYTLSGTLMASVALHPSPNVAQFGVFDFFGYNQANFTIPSNLGQGFYKLQFLSSYTANSTSGVQLGNFTSGLYISSPTLNYSISIPATVYEGQALQVTAKIFGPGGAPVDSGVVFATAIPSGYAFESYLADVDGYTGVPMQYNVSSGLWVGAIQIPSPLTSIDAFTGNVPGVVSGPWTVFISGESSNGTNVAPAKAYLDVLPYTYYANDSLDASNIGTAPLVSVNGTGYLLSDIGTPNLTVTGVNLTIADSSIGKLTVINGNVRLVSSNVNTLTASDSGVTLTHGTEVNSLSLESSTLSSFGSFYPGQAGPPLRTYLAYAVAIIAVVALVISVLSYRRKGNAAPVPPQV